MPSLRATPIFDEEAYAELVRRREETEQREAEVAAEKEAARLEALERAAELELRVRASKQDLNDGKGFKKGGVNFIDNRGTGDTGCGSSFPVTKTSNDRVPGSLNTFYSDTVLYNNCGPVGGNPGGYSAWSYGD